MSQPVHSPSPVAPTSASRTRRLAQVTLIVLHSDPAPAAEALAAYTAPRAQSAPHYYVAADGMISALVPEARAARHSGLATWRHRPRQIDPISIGITLEHIPGAPMAPPQLLALAGLIRQIQERYGLNDSALMRWEPHVQAQELGPGALLPLALPPLPLRVAPPISITLGQEPAMLEGESHCVPPPLPDGPPPVTALLSAADDPQAAQRLWLFLAQEAFRQRGEGFRTDWAFHQRAAQANLGAPLARSAGANDQVRIGATNYGLQVFGRDMLFNPIPQWSNVQSLNDTLSGSIPANGLGLELLKASYKQTGQVLHPDWAFHQVAVRERLGVPLGGSYTIALGAQRYNVQVFALDTLYTPLAHPPAQTNWGDVRRMTAAETPDQLRQALWAETYKATGAPFQADSLFAQLALRDRLGAPLSGPYDVEFEGTRYTVQIFAGDTLFSAGGAPERANTLPRPADLAGASYSAASAPADPQDTSRRPTFTMLPVPTSANPRVSQFFGYTHYAKANGMRFYSQSYGCHSGLDIGVPIGTPLLALDAGVVYCAGVPKQDCSFGGCPPLVIVVRYGSVYAVYGHCSAIHVRPGQVVQPGNLLGLSGEYPTGMPHLHFEVRPGTNPGQAFNPVEYFSPALQNAYFAQQLATLGGVRHFCCGSYTDQPPITFGRMPIDARPCER